MAKETTKDNNWATTTLGEVSLDIAYGYTASASKSNVGPKFLRITDIQDDFIDWSGVPYCLIDENKRNKYQLEVGDVVVARTGNSTGATATIKESVDAVFASYLIRYRIDPSLADYNFVDFMLRSPFWKGFVKSNLGGSAQAGANAKVFAGFPMPIPSLPEQKAIAAVLSSLDDKIELLRKQNETLEAIAQAIFKEWFVNFNFPDKNGKPYRDSGGKMIDSELGKIPEGWRTGKLSDEFGIVMGQSPPGSSYNQTNEGEVFFQGRTDFQERFPQIRLYTTEPKRMAEAFDVLVSVRAPVGDINVASEKCCIGRGLGAVRGKYRSYALYKMKNLQEALRGFEAEGTVFGSIGKDDFKNIDVIVPVPEFVKLLDNTIAHMDGKILNNHKQIQTLTKLRDTLLPKLMSGQVRVKVE